MFRRVLLLISLLFVTALAFTRPAVAEKDPLTEIHSNHQPAASDYLNHSR